MITESEHQATVEIGLQRAAVHFPRMIPYVAAKWGRPCYKYNMLRGSNGAERLRSLRAHISPRSSLIDPDAQAWLKRLMAAAELVAISERIAGVPRSDRR